MVISWNKCSKNKKFKSATKWLHHNYSPKSKNSEKYIYSEPSSTEISGMHNLILFGLPKHSVMSLSILQNRLNVRLKHCYQLDNRRDNIIEQIGWGDFIDMVNDFSCLQINCLFTWLWIKNRTFRLYFLVFYLNYLCYVMINDYDWEYSTHW